MANKHTTKKVKVKVKDNSSSNSDGSRRVVRVVKAWMAHRSNCLMTIPKEIAELVGVGAGTELLVTGTADGFTVTKAS